MGLGQGVSLVVGIVIGSGIFLTPNGIDQKIGAFGFGAILMVWVVGGLLSLAGALTYAELGAMLPTTGGQYVFIREAFGKLCAFLFGWMEFWVARAGSIAALAVAFSLHAVLIYRGMGAQAATQLPALEADPLVPWVAIGCVLLLAAINVLGVRYGAWVQVAFTVLKVSALLAVIGMAIYRGGQLTGSLTPFFRPGKTNLLAAFGAAMVASLWSYDGWTNGAAVSEEMKNPQRNVPRSLMLGTLIIVAVYVAVNWAYHSLLTIEQVQGSSAVAATAALRAVGAWGGLAVAFGALASIFGAANGTILTGPRIFYAMAKDRVFFPGLAKVHARFSTPYRAVLAQCGWAILLIGSAAIGRPYTQEPIFDTLFTYVIFSSWVFYGMGVAAVFVLRRTRPDADRPYRTWGYPWTPAAFVLVAGAFVLNTLLTQPIQSLVGLGIIALGLPAYWLWSRRADARPAS